MLLNLYIEVLTLRSPKEKKKVSENYFIPMLFGRSNNPACFQAVLSCWVLGGAERTMRGVGISLE